MAEGSPAAQQRLTLGRGCKNESGIIIRVELTLRIRQHCLWIRLKLLDQPGGFGWRPDF
jgi:hypothetical protein